jgi:hypothetical protein
MLNGRLPVSITGEGMAEIFAWRTEPGFALHVLNYNNPNMLRGWFTNTYPLGPQNVSFELPAGARISQVRLLRAGIDVQHTQTGRVVKFTIPSVSDYEVVALV